MTRVTRENRPIFCVEEKQLVADRLRELGHPLEAGDEVCIHRRTVRSTDTGKWQVHKNFVRWGIDGAPVTFGTRVYMLAASSTPLADVSFDYSACGHLPSYAAAVTARERLVRLAEKRKTRVAPVRSELVASDE